MSNQSNRQSKHWSFTLNNPEEQITPATWDSIQFCVWQHETGENGTPHYQGYVQFTKRKRLTAVKRLLVAAHWEISRSSPANNYEYCTSTTKPGPRTPGDNHGPWEHGTMLGGQGNRGDLTAVRETILAGATVENLWDEHFSAMVRYSKGFMTFKRLKSSKRNWAMEVVVLYGPTGTGKSHYAHTMYGDSLYVLPTAKGSGTYWDDYDGQETVLIDEMYGNRFSFGFLLQLCDRYEFTVPVHGGAGHQFVSRRIVMTSNSHPRDWYNVPNYAAFERRITVLQHMTVRYVEPEAPPPPAFPIFQLPGEEEEEEEEDSIQLYDEDDVIEEGLLRGLAADQSGVLWESE